MKIRTLILTALAAVLSISIPHALIAAPVAPYTEHFTSDAQDWIDGKTMGPSTWETTGGPDGSSYISVTMNTSTNATNASRILFRGNSTDFPELHASDDKLAGDWLAGGINHFSAWVYHEAPVALPYFARFTATGASPATAALDGTIVQPFTWTKLDYIIHTSQIGITLFPEGAPQDNLTTFTGTFQDLERIQIGFNVPESMSMSATSYKYGVDQVAVYTGEIPEPATWCLALCAVSFGMARRRRSA